jgi:hypothetical protein
MKVLSKLLWWSCLVFALILLFKGAALFIGMTILSPGNEWTNIINILLLIIDILVAAGLLRVVFRSSDLEKSILLYVLLVTTVITHAYRAIEYFLPIPTRFLFNEVLFLVNGLKLVLAVLVLVVGLYLYYKSVK